VSVCSHSLVVMDVHCGRQACQAHTVCHCVAYPVCSTAQTGSTGLPLFMCPHVIIIQACVSRPQTAPPSQGAGPMGGILWRYGAKGGPYGLLLLL
jgi:hypothetical protein